MRLLCQSGAVTRCYADGHMVAGTLRVNLGGHYLSCKHAIPAMVETVGRGAIVNVASIQANRAYGGAPNPIQGPEH